jgi:glutathione synthase/RimK-type ligase-like ATP-grasp enzyme
MTICVVGDTADLSAVYLTWAGGRAGRRMTLLDERDLGPGWSFDLDGGGGTLRAADGQIAFEEITGVFARFDPEPDPPPGVQLDGPDLHQFRAERRFAIYQFLERLPCPVANRPRAGRANGSKPLQMNQLEAAGFLVPRWLVSSSPRDVAEFVADLGGRAIYKAVSGLRSRVREVDRQLTERLEAGTTPVVVQEYIGGVDVRVHVVAGECIATEVDGTGIDYRFDGSKSYRPADVPDDIACRCARMADEEGLLLAGYDFRVTPGGEWFCLESNPMPSFIPYQWAAGQPIGEALIEALSAHP